MYKHSRNRLNNDTMTNKKINRKAINICPMDNIIVSAAPLDFIAPPTYFDELLE